ncbi:MAG: sulfoxide reductase heme-binding subunit YedZ [Gammaproteobacteria bacterium]|jgi:sulfoxide reductase heme-binding subunit YedZ
MQKFYKPLLFSISLVPFGSVIYNGFTGNLTANPIEYITHFTGDWTIYFLLITLSITPLRNLTRKNSLTRYRRMIGLFAFFYGCLHFLTYFAVDQFFDFSAILEDIIERPYITVGFTAFVLLIPLTITSTKKMVARLGSKWRTLHSSIYLITGLGILHYYWLVKSDVRIPLLLATIYILLMSLRLKWAKNMMKLRFLNTRSA